MTSSNVRTNRSLTCQFDTKGKIKLRKQRMDEFLVSAVGKPSRKLKLHRSQRIESVARLDTRNG